MAELLPQEHKEEERGKEYERLTSQKAEKLLFLSYRFSQGSITLQSHLFYWLHFANPEWRIDAEMQEHITKQFGAHAKKFLGKSADLEKKTSPRFHSARNVEEIEASAQLEIRLMQDFFDGNMSDSFDVHARTKEEVVAEIAKRVIDKDFEYLKNIEGRPRSHEGEHINAVGDPFLSHFVYYGFQGHSTGMKEYDDLFAEIAAYVRENIKNGAWTAENYPELFDVMRIYNEKHPEGTVSMDVLTRTEDADKLNDF